MSVKRYDVEAYSWFGTAHWTLVESVDGDFVYASDYNELRERVAWMMECEGEQRSIIQEAFHPKSYHRTRHTEFLMTLIVARKAVEELL